MTETKETHLLRGICQMLMVGILPYFYHLCLLAHSVFHIFLEEQY